MANAILRRMTEQDLPAVMEIERDSFSVPWSYDEMEAECTNPISHYLVVEVEGEIAAYGGFWHIVDEGHITNIATSRKFRRQGFGELLVRGLIELAKSLGVVSMTLEVRVGNAPARALYEKCGFVCAGIRPGYYQDNREDACIYWAKWSE
ncbi:MAG: ribosomal protein S18-alanine N-acetyltransferase [Christensenellales bacterium]|jgi:ribosomal-protein-alanine N-acetyltransferase